MAEVNEKIIKMIEEARGIPAKVEPESNLYTDMGFDSLSFIQLLLRIEERYSISFGIEEMDKCLQVGRLIDTVNRKLGGWRA